MNFLTIFMGVFMVGSSKSYAGFHIIDEKFLSSIASLGCVFGAMRFIWSFFLDKFSYRTIYSFLCILNILVGTLTPYAVE